MIFPPHNPRSVLDALVIYSRLHGKPYSAKVLTEGLPVSETEEIPKLFSTKETSSLFSRAAKRAGFKTRIMEVSIHEINELILPCILLLKTKDDEVNACILESFDELKQNANIIIPEIGEMVNTVPLEKLKKSIMELQFF